MADTQEQPAANIHDEEEHDEGDRRPRRRPRSNRREPAVYVGNIPRGTRVSAFKAEVRGRNVNPLRVMWKGTNRHAFLFFEHEDDIEDAISKLEDLTLDGKEVKVERSTERERAPRKPREVNGPGSNRAPKGRRGPGSSPRGPRSGSRAPTVFVGGIPKGTRVSELKALVRNQGVEPLRVLWRGGAGYTFLFFEQEEEAEGAITKLATLEVGGKPLRIERGGRGPSESHDEDGHDENERPQRRERRTSNNRRRNNSYNKQQQPQQERLPALYIGGIPKGTRASEFKALVRAKDLAPFRLIWRLMAGHAYLLFQTEDEVDDALKKLAEFEVGDKMVRVERSTREEKEDHENEA
jgi:RNA recognition motif-containing protein